MCADNTTTTQDRSLLNYLIQNRYSRDELTISLQCEHYENIYRSLQYTDVKFGFDSKLNDEKDTRRCLAVFSHIYSPVCCLKIWSHLYEKLKGFLNGQHCLYEFLVCRNKQQREEKFQAQAHLTWMHFSSFNRFDRQFTGIQQCIRIFRTTQNAMRSGILPHGQRFVVFHRVHAFANCITLLGLPNFMMKDWREMARNSLQQHDFFGEPHAQSFVHMTLLRFTSNISYEDVQQIVQLIECFLPIKIYLSTPHLATCSWKMLPQEVEIHC